MHVDSQTLKFQIVTHLTFMKWELKEPQKTVGERKGGRETNEYGNPCWRHQEAYFRTLDIGAHRTFLEALESCVG